MKFDGILFVICCLGLGSFGCLIAADLVEEFELSIYLDLAGLAFTMMAMVVAWVGLDERRRITIETHDRYIVQLMERVNDLEKSQKSQNP